MDGLLYRNDRLVNSLSATVVDKAIKLYPNPINEFLYIQGAQTNCKITISDITGKVYNEINSTGGQIKISTAHLSKGIYFVHINDGKNKWVEKFIKS